MKATPVRTATVEPRIIQRRWERGAGDASGSTDVSGCGGVGAGCGGQSAAGAPGERGSLRVEKSWEDARSYGLSERVDEQ
jgi:hypothetical protein